MGYIDRTLKILADKFAQDYVNWILSRSFILVEKLCTDIPTITRYADLVYRVRDKEGKQYIFNLEFQAQKSKDPMNLRMLGYNVRLLEKHKIPVYSTVIYLVEEAYEEDQGYFKSVFLGEEVLNFRYKVIKLWELSASEFLKNKIMGLYPLLGLTKLTEPKEATLNNIIKELKSIKDPILSKDMLFSFKVLSSLKHSKDLLDALIRKEEIMESTILKEIYEEALVKERQEGQKEGLELGRLENLQDNIMGVLLARFEVPYKSEKQLEDTIKAIKSIPVLQKLIIDAVKTQSFEDFLKILDKLEL